MRSVPIQIFINDKPELLEAGYWELGVWDRKFRRDEKEDIWGLVVDGFPSQMCYGFDYANPWMGIKRKRQSPEEWSRWYFDVGRKLYCTLDELERCLRELNIEESYRET